MVSPERRSALSISVPPDGRLRQRRCQASSGTFAGPTRTAPVWAWFLPDIGADWGIENVAALPEYRRRGLVTALLNEALRQGHEHGCKLAQITTVIGNDSAQAAYLK